MDLNEMLVKITSALMEFLNNIPNWNWDSIIANVKNFVVGGGMVVAVKYAIPFFKNSNKPVLTKLASVTETVLAYGEELKTLHTENATLKTALDMTIGYLETSAQINLSSRTLTTEQKALYDAWITRYKADFGTNATVEKVEQIMADNTITREEVVELGNNVPVIERVLGTPIQDLMGGSK